MIIEVNGQEMEAIKVNGRSYPLWSQFCLDPSWIGGTLQDLDPDSGGATGRIINISLLPNGADSAMFEVTTDQGWSCACDTKYLAVDNRQEPGWMQFCGYGGHRWRIAKPQDQGTSLCA